MNPFNISLKKIWCKEVKQYTLKTLGKAHLANIHTVFNIKNRKWPHIYAGCILIFIFMTFCSCKLNINYQNESI